MSFDAPCQIVQCFNQSSTGGVIVLIVYVDIIISGSDSISITDLKAYLSRQFYTMNLGTLRYFLGIVVARFKMGMYLSQRKYVLDLLSETGMLDSRPIDSYELSCQA